MTKTGAAAIERPMKKWTAYVPTVAACGVVLLVAGWPYQGFFIAAPFLILLVWVPWSIVRALLKPEQFIPTAIKICLWIATFSIVFDLNRIYVADARHTADRYAHAIEQYKEAHGVYPRNLKAADLQDPGARILGYYYDSKDANSPMLMYRDTFDPFDRSYYNFTQRTWEFQPD